MASVYIGIYYEYQNEMKQINFFCFSSNHTHIQECNPRSTVTVLVAIVVTSWPQQYQDPELASTNLPRNQSQTKQTISNRQADVSTQDLV